MWDGSSSRWPPSLCQNRSLNEAPHTVPFDNTRLGRGHTYGSLVWTNAGGTGLPEPGADFAVDGDDFLRWQTEFGGGGNAAVVAVLLTPSLF
jgi:hypothetical protein